MGARGPKPLSAEQLRKRGSWRAKQRARDEAREGRREASVPHPRCPKWLSKRAKAEWRRVVPVLIKLDVVNGLDESLIALYCQAFADYAGANEVLDCEGATYKASTGLVKRHPATVLRDQAHRRLLQTIRELGLSPIARERLGIEDFTPETTSTSAKARFFDKY